MGGKTVYHCHFLTHEDAGMIENFMLTDGSDAAAALESDLDYDGHVRDGVECGPGGCKAANANLEPHMEITRLENPRRCARATRGVSPSWPSTLQRVGQRRLPSSRPRSSRRRRPKRRPPTPPRRGRTPRRRKSPRRSTTPSR